MNEMLYEIQSREKGNQKGSDCADEAVHLRVEFSFFGEEIASASLNITASTPPWIMESLLEA